MAPTSKSEVKCPMWSMILLVMGISVMSVNLQADSREAFTIVEEVLESMENYRDSIRTISYDFVEAKELPDDSGDGTVVTWREGHVAVEIGGRTFASWQQTEIGEDGSSVAIHTIIIVRDDMIHVCNSYNGSPPVMTLLPNSEESASLGFLRAVPNIHRMMFVDTPTITGGLRRILEIGPEDLEHLAFTRYGEKLEVVVEFRGTTILRLYDAANDLRPISEEHWIQHPDGPVLFREILFEHEFVGGMFVPRRYVYRSTLPLSTPQFSHGTKLTLTNIKVNQNLPESLFDEEYQCNSPTHRTFRSESGEILDTVMPQSGEPGRRSRGPDQMIRSTGERLRGTRNMFLVVGGILILSGGFLLLKRVGTP